MNAEDRIINVYYVLKLQFYFCVIETKSHKFFTGVAVKKASDPDDFKMARKLSLRRACEAMVGSRAQKIYKLLWSQARLRVHAKEAHPDCTSDTCPVCKAANAVRYGDEIPV